MKNIVKFLIKIYTAYSRYYTLPACRFSPTCSDYTLQAIENKGVIKGILIGIRRVLHCHPFSMK